MHSFAVTEAAQAVGLFVHTQVIFLDFICLNCSNTAYAVHFLLMLLFFFFFFPFLYALRVGLLDILRNHKFVGCAQPSRSLFQYQVRSDQSIALGISMTTVLSGAFECEMCANHTLGTALK